jgi:hypothetical protein
MGVLLLVWGIVSGCCGLEPIKQEKVTQSLFQPDISWAALSIDSAALQGGRANTSNWIAASY